MTRTLIIPTYNEADSLPELIRRVRCVMPNLDILVVDDDSPDRTADVAINMGCSVYRRKGKRGLTSAVVDGIEHTNADEIAVMDADCQHPPEALPAMFGALRTNDVVIGSRYCDGGSTVGWPWHRRLVSRIANAMVWPLLASVKDRGSGFWACRRAVLPVMHDMNMRGWKGLQEILLKGAADRIVEIPIRFECRQHGRSKFNVRQMVVYVGTVGMLYWWKLRRLFKFGVAEGIGAVVGFSLTFIGVEVAGLHYMVSLTIATAVGFMVKYFANTIWVFARSRHPDDADYDWRSFYHGNPIQKWWKRQVAQTVWRYIPYSERLLDIGCGSSPIIAHYPNATGVDMNEAKLKYLKSRLDGTIRLLQMDATQLLYDDGYFSDAICCEVLEHLSDPKAAIREIARVVRPGGRIVLAVPDSSRVLWGIAERFTPYRSQHEQKFDIHKLVTLADEAGLVIRDFRRIAGCDIVARFEKPQD